MFKNFENKYSKIITVFIAILVFSVGLYAGVSAYTGTIFGVAQNRGYFTDYYYAGGIQVIKEVAFPAQYDTVSEFVGLLYYYNIDKPNDTTDSVGSRHRYNVGAAFIVCTMLGQTRSECSTNGYADYSNPTGYKFITASGWNELTARLNDRQSKGLIEWNHDSTGETRTINSRFLYRTGIGYVYNGATPVYDDAFYSVSSFVSTNDPTILIKNENGSIAYELIRRCANPTGNVLGMKKWEVAPSTAVDRSTANVGDVITWTHTVRSNGPEITNMTVSYQSVNKSVTGAIVSGSLPIGSPNGTTLSVPSYYTVTAADAGQTLCRATSANPRAWNNSGLIESAQVCVTISGSWSVTTSSTADRVTAAPTQTITWIHTVTNIGPNNTSSNVIYHYQDRGDIGNAVGLDNTLPNGSVINASSSHTSTYDVKSADVGKTICRATSASPLAWDNNGWTESAPACVSVPYDWTIGVTSTIKSVTAAAPGGTITWTHTVTNSGPTATNSNVLYYFQNRDRLGATRGVDNTLASGSAALFSTVFETTHPIEQDNVGHNLCRTTVASPASVSNNGLIESGWACVFIPYNYNLIPGVSIDKSGVVEANSVYKVTPRIDNEGPTKSRSTDWQLSLLVIQPGSSADNPAGGDSNIDPCSYFNNASTNCSIASSGSVASIPLGIYNPADYNGTVNDSLAPGTRLCFALSVRPYSDDNGNWRHSSIICIIIGKKPKVQIWGGNLVSGGGISTSSSVKNIIATGNASIFGSWGEYGIFAAGSINGMASASALAGGLDIGPSATMSAIDPCSYSDLSFTNVPIGVTECSGLANSIGNYNYKAQARDVSSSFTGSQTITMSDIVVNDLPIVDKTYVGSKIGNLNLTASTLARDKTVVLKVDGDVTISGNLFYENGPYTNLNQLPQLIISANNIYITDSVTNVDAWLISRGVINTCSNVVETNLTIATCNQLLTVNGPVVTSELLLRRTAGSDPATSGNPAEVFNLRADAYLWSMSRASIRSLIQSVYITEISPRF